VQDVDPGPSVSLGRVTVYQNVNTPGANVKLTTSDVLLADNEINALIIDGNNIDLTAAGFNQLTIGNLTTIGNTTVGGIIASRGSNNAVDVPLLNFGNGGLSTNASADPLFLVESGSLHVSSTLIASFNGNGTVFPALRKERPGNLILSGDSTASLQGTVTVNQGTLIVQNSGALGTADNTAGNGTVVSTLAAIVLDGSIAGAVNVGMSV